MFMSHYATEVCKCPGMAHRAELPTDREIKVGYFNSTSSLVRSSGVTLENLIEQWANICRN